MKQYHKVKNYAADRELSPWTVYRQVERQEVEFERFGRSIRIVTRDGDGVMPRPSWGQGASNG